MRATPRKSMPLLISEFCAVSMCSSAPTPLYIGYQELWQATPFMVTIVFAAYALSLLVSLLTVGRMSDYLGR